MTGGSNGSLMSHILGEGLADRVTAIAPIVGSIPRPVYQDFHPVRPVSVLMINDRGDPSVRWEGGEGGRSNFVSMPETIAKWQEINGCTSEVTVEADAIVGQPDNARVSHTVWSGCSLGTQMEYYVVEAGRHGHPTAVLDKENGRGLYEVIWNFFAAQVGR